MRVLVSLLAATFLLASPRLVRADVFGCGGHHDDYEDPDLSVPRDLSIPIDQSVRPDLSSVDAQAMAPLRTRRAAHAGLGVLMLLSGSAIFATRRRRSRGPLL